MSDIERETIETEEANIFSVKPKSLETEWQ